MLSTILVAAVYLTLQNNVPVAQADVDEVGREVRLYITAYSITAAAQKATCYDVEEGGAQCKPIFGDVFMAAGMLVSLGKNETYFSRQIQEGKCGWHECGGKNRWLDSRAKSYWQAEKPPTMSKDEFDNFAGLGIDNVSSAAWYAVKHLSGSYYVCRGMTGAFSGYARGQDHCDWGPAKGRARDAYYYTSIIRREFKKLEKSANSS